MVDYNPLARQVCEFEDHLARLQAKQTKLTGALRRNAQFSQAATQDKIRAHTEALTDLRRRLKAANADAEETRCTLLEWDEKARLGWDPTYWFSDQRATAKKRLRQTRDKAAELTGQIEQLHDDIATHEAAIKKHRAALRRHDKFDRAANQAELDDITGQLPLREQELEDLRARKARVDKRLAGPLATLKTQEERRTATRREIKNLENRLAELERERADAEDLDAQITRAATSYDKAMLHQESEHRFGDGSPARVAADRRRKAGTIRRQLSGARRRLESIERNLDKTKNRIAEEAAAAARDIRAVIIDGSNLAHQGGTFIGLAALKPLIDGIGGSVEVTVVFDASIHRLLGMGGPALERALPRATVHVVASGTSADVTILDLAEDELVYVISNDRYGDFLDKPAVRDGRILRFEIVNGLVLVDALDFKAPLTTRR